MQFTDGVWERGFGTVLMDQGWAGVTVIGIGRDDPVYVLGKRKGWVLCVRWAWERGPAAWGRNIPPR